MILPSFYAYIGRREHRNVYFLVDLFISWIKVEVDTYLEINVLCHLTLSKTG